MSTLMKRGKTWYVRFQHGGKDIWRSTKQTSKSKAEDESRKIIEREKGTRSVSIMFDEVLAQITAIEDSAERDKTRRELARKLLQGITARLAISDAWEVWLANPNKGRRGEQKESTIEGYWAIWKRFAVDHKEEDKRGWLRREYPGVKYLHEVTDTMTDAYAADLWGSGVSPSTFNAHKKFLKSMFQTLSIRAGMELNPWNHIKTLEKETESKRMLSKKELAEVCSSATGERRYWIAIGLYTGLRLGDVITLRWDEVDLDSEEIKRVPLKVDRKGQRKEITIPIHPVLAAMFRELRKDSSDGAVYLFPDAVKKYRRERASITKPMQKFFEDCGIETTEQATNGHRRKAIVRVGFHSLRHSFVSLCASNKVPQSAIMELVGHGSPAMTAIYTHTTDKARKQAIGKLPAAVFDGKTAKPKAKRRAKVKA